jgi:hypothetical protein
MTPFSDSDHTWFRRRLPDHLLDLLVEDERERFEKHARACAPCGRVLASAQGARADWWDGAGHPPVGVLLKWNSKAGGDRVLELAHTHVAHCESCRQDLEDLLGVPAADTRVHALTPVRRWRFVPALSRGLAVAAGLVAVAAVTLLLTRGGEAPPAAPGQVPAPPETSGAMGASSSRSGAPSTPTRPSAGRTGAPVKLVSADRGEPTAPTRLRIEPGVTQVPLTLPALFVPDGTPIAIELHDAAGALVSLQVLPSERALRPGGVLLPVRGLAAGAYRLVVRWTDTAIGETTREFALDVRNSR